MANPQTLNPKPLNGSQVSLCEQLISHLGKYRHQAEAQTSTSAPATAVGRRQRVRGHEAREEEGGRERTRSLEVGPCWLFKLMAWNLIIKIEFDCRSRPHAMACTSEQLHCWALLHPWRCAPEKLERTANFEAPFASWGPLACMSALKILDAAVSS